MIRMLLTVLFSVLLCWLLILAFQALGGAAIQEVLVAVAISTAAGVLAYRKLPRAKRGKA